MIKTPLIDAIVRWFVKLPARRGLVVRFRSDLWDQIWREAGRPKPRRGDGLISRICHVEIEEWVR